LSIALGTKRHAGEELMNCTRKLCLSLLRELATVPYVFLLCQKYFLGRDNLTEVAVGRSFVVGCLYADAKQNDRDACPFCRALMPE
jgi:hypothetical protein